MECKDFQKLINDFIFDKIEYSEDLKEFLNHAKICKNCGEELELYYTIRRGLGDVKAPDDSEESVDATQELENIINSIDNYIYSFTPSYGKYLIDCWLGDELVDKLLDVSCQYEKLIKLK